MFDDIVNIENFKQIINYKDEGTRIDLHVEATVNNKIVYQDNTPCYIAYDFGYEQCKITIDWKISNDVMLNLGLHGAYNTNFQRMKLKNNSLIIIGSNYSIKLQNNIH